jgi:hypothetical protein
MKRDSMVVGCAMLLLAGAGFYRVAHTATAPSLVAVSSTPGLDIETVVLVRKLENGGAGGAVALARLSGDPRFTEAIKLKACFIGNQRSLTQTEPLAAALGCQTPLPAIPSRGGLRADKLDHFAADPFVKQNSFGWTSRAQCLSFSNDYEAGAAMLLQQAMQEELQPKPNWKLVNDRMEQGAAYLTSDTTPAGRCLHHEYDLRRAAHPGSPDYLQKLFEDYRSQGEWALASHYLLRTPHPDLALLLKTGRATGSAAICQELLAAAAPGSSPDLLQYAKILTLRINGKLREALVALQPLTSSHFWQTDPDALRLVRDLNLAFILTRENFQQAVAAQGRLDKSGQPLTADDLLKSAWLHDLHGDTDAARKLYRRYLAGHPGNINREAIVRNRLDGGPRPFFVHIVVENQGGFRNLILGEGVPEAQIPPIRVFANRMGTLSTSENVRLDGLGAFDGHYRRLDCALKFRDPAAELNHRYRFRVEYQTIGDPQMNPKPFATEDLCLPFHSFLFLSMTPEHAKMMIAQEPEMYSLQTTVGSFLVSQLHGWDAPAAERNQHGWPAFDSDPQLSAEAVFKLFEAPIDSPEWSVGATQ